MAYTNDSKSFAARLVGSSPTSGTMAHRRTPILNPDKNLQAYIIGVALGDGNLSKMVRSTRLRITCDNKYPKLMGKITESLQLLLPENKVGLVKRKRNCTDIYVYSNHLENLLGWKSNEGSKFKQRITIPEWIKHKAQYKIACLRGLIETDGSIYTDRGYKMVNFTSNILSLASDVTDLIASLDFKPHIYKVTPKKNKYNFFNQQPFYHIRLSKNVSEFLDLVKPDKS